MEFAAQANRPSPPPAAYSCCACFVAGEPGGGCVLRCCGRMRRRGRRGSADGAGAGCPGRWAAVAWDAPPRRSTIQERALVDVECAFGAKRYSDQWAKRQISVIKSNHSSLVSSASFIIFRIIPFPIFSPGCIGIRVVRPSGCRMNRWLPFCLICRKPMFSNALITFLAGRGLIVSIKQKPQLVGCQ